MWRWLPLLVACSGKSRITADAGDPEGSSNGSDTAVVDTGSPPGDGGEPPPDDTATPPTDTASSPEDTSGSPADTGPTDDTGETDPATDEAEDMVAAAQAFLDGLDAEQRDAAQFDLSDPERLAWSNLPHAVRPRLGVSFGDMTEAQAEAAWALIRASLSARGEQRAEEIMLVEQLLWDDGDESAIPDAFFFTLFDVPSMDSPWAWQLDGHHLAINFTVVGADVSISPSLWGVAPTVWPEGEHEGLEPMELEEDLAYAWIASLDEEQLALAVLSDEDPSRLLAGPDSRPDAWPEPEGIPTTELTEVQRTELLALVQVYVGNLAEAQSERRMAEIDASFDDASVAWHGGTSPGEAMYYRIQGSRVLVEFDHTRGPTHIHAVYRDPANDYGVDWLAEHLSAFHAD